MTKLTAKKPDSSPLKSPSKGLFSIYIIEHEDGTLSVVPESVGSAANALALGIDMMSTLEEVASFSDGGIRIQLHNHSTLYQ